MTNYDDTGKDLRLRIGIDEGDDWPAYTSLGGYTVVYYAADCEVLCARCMNTENEIHFDPPDDDWRVVDVGVYWEGPTIHCAHCNEEIESSYGDPEEEE